ncbi:MAG: single-stranded DNA-binding protein [Solirubrobacteraceae bacterium]
MTTLAVAKVPPPQFQVITLVGHLTADPVLRTIDENRKVCDMHLAVNDHNDRPPLFIDVATFGSQAEACAKYLAKGRAIAVTGRLIYREWVADDGTRRSKHAVVGHVQFGGRLDDAQPSDSGHADDDQASF